MSLSRYLRRFQLNWSKLLIVVFLGALLFSLLKLVLPLIMGDDLGTKPFGKGLPIKAPDNFVLAFHFYDKEDEGQIEMELEAIIVPDSPFPGHQTCIKNIYVDYGSEKQDILAFQDHRMTDLLDSRFIPCCSSGRGRGYPASLEFSDLCTENYFYQAFMDNDLDILLVRGDLINTLNLNVTPSFFFPIDNRFLQLFVWIETVEGKKLAPIIAGLTTSPKWDEQVIVSRVSFSDGTEKTAVDILYFRPLAQRVLTAVLLIALPVLIIALIFINEIGSFLEVSIGVLLGLWGVQDILVPSNIPSPNMISSMILSYYVLFATAVFIRLFVRPVWLRRNFSRLVEYPPQEIGELATHSMEDTQPPSLSSTQINFIQHEEVYDSAVNQKASLKQSNLYQRIALVLLALLIVLVGMLHFRRQEYY